MREIRSVLWVVLAAYASSVLIGCSSPDGHRDPTTVAGARLPIALLSAPSHPPSRPVLAAISKAMRLPAESLAKNAHRATTNYGPVWLVPIDSTICLLTKLRTGYSCSPSADVVHHGLTIGLVINPGNESSRYFVLFGVVQNETKRVILKLGRRGCASVSVRDNAFAFRSQEPVWLTGASSCPQGRAAER